MKPDWKDAPEWANWLAMDGDGTWCWHERRPSANYLAFYWEAPRGSGKAWAGEENSTWESQIESRPQTTKPAEAGSEGQGA